MLECLSYFNIVPYISTFTKLTSTVLFSFRTIGAVILGVAVVKLLSLICSLIRRQLEQALWRVEVVSNDPRVHPVDTHGVCYYMHFLSVEILSICDE